MGVWYTTRERVKRALDTAETARNNTQVDAAIEAASRTIDGYKPGDGLLHRRFYPQFDTRYFDWPGDARSWRLWLDAHELISVTALVSGGITIPASDFLLRPDHGPPYSRIEIDLSTASAFTASTTMQRAIAVTGVFGFCADSTPAGALAAAVSSTTATTVDVTDSAAVGVGHIIMVGSERMLVTGKTMLTTGQSLQTPLTASQANVAVAVTDGTAFAVDEVLLLDSERMLIVDIAANTLTVKRAWDGSVLATHTGSTIYAGRRLTVERGALGTTAAAHSISAAITRHVVPGLVAELAVAEALNNLLQEGGGYSRIVGSGTALSIGQGFRNNARAAPGGGLPDLRDAAYLTYGRKARKRAV